MKKIVIIILLICVCLIAYFAYNNKTEEIIIEEAPSDESIVSEDIHEPDEAIYTDSNPMSVGFYLSKNSKFELVEEFTAPWYVGPPDICVLSVLPNNQDIVNESSFKNAFQKCLDEYENVNDYKIGYHMKFSMKDGTIIDKNILTVEDAEADESFSKIMVFLYDDVNIKPGQSKYHVTKETFSDETIFTSIKLTGGVSANDVLSPIELTVFTYKDENDFDPDNGMYRGNSSYTINVNRK